MLVVVDIVLVVVEVDVVLDDVLVVEVGVVDVEVVVVLVETVEVVLVVVDVVVDVIGVLVVLEVVLVVVAATHIPPAQESWQVIVMLYASVPKQYHSVTLLLSEQESYSVSTESPSCVNSTQLEFSVFMPLS